MWPDFPIKNSWNETYRSFWIFFRNLEFGFVSDDIEDQVFQIFFKLCNWLLSSIQISANFPSKRSFKVCWNLALVVSGHSKLYQTSQRKAISCSQFGLKSGAEIIFKSKMFRAKTDGLMSFKWMCKLFGFLCSVSIAVWSALLRSIHPRKRTYLIIDFV